MIYTRPDMQRVRNKPEVKLENLRFEVACFLLFPGLYLSFFNFVQFIPELKSMIWMWDIWKLFGYVKYQLNGGSIWGTILLSPLFIIFRNLGPTSYVERITWLLYTEVDDALEWNPVNEFRSI